VSLFVVSPEIEDRDEVEVDNWAKYPKSPGVHSFTIFWMNPTSHSSFTQYNALKALECMQFPNDYEHAMPH
jgi:hypothetical protein